MNKRREVGLDYMKTLFNFTIMVAVGCPAALYILWKLNVINDMSLGYIFLPGYLLMLIIIVLMRLAAGIVDDKMEDKADDK